MLEFDSIFIMKSKGACAPRWQQLRVATTGSMCEACREEQDIEIQRQYAARAGAQPTIFRSCRGWSCLSTSAAEARHRIQAGSSKVRNWLHEGRGKRRNRYQKSEMTPSTRGWSSWRQRWPKWGKQSFERPFWRRRGQSKKIKRRMHQQVRWRVVENRKRWYSTKIWLHQVSLLPLARLALEAPWRAKY